MFVLLFVLTGAIVLWGMLTSSPKVPSWIYRHDKLMHFAAFALLAALAQAGWPNLSGLALWSILTAMGLLAEGLQQLTATRSFCWRDAMANALGAGSTLVLLAWLV